MPLDSGQNSQINICKTFCFFSLQNLEQHQNTGYCSLECKTCSKKFKNVQGLSQHDKVHSVAYYCHLCGKEFKHFGSRTAKQRLANHLPTCGKPRLLPAPRAKIFKCRGSSCDEAFSVKRALISHEHICKFVIHECDRCSLKFNKKRLLGLHKTRGRCSKFELL